MKKLLYLTFIDMDAPTSTGSSVRPHKMEEAFKELNIDVKTIDGANNIINVRKASVKKAYQLLDEWKPDMCYIEPPAGPLFYYGDVRLIKKIHKMRIPQAIFYRDAYWRYPEYYINDSTPLKDKLKHLVIRFIQSYQLKVFNKCFDVIYFPSATMAKEFECKNKSTLPPGSFRAVKEQKQDYADPLQFIFVGGASENHGCQLTLQSFAKVNQDTVKAKLFYICPEDQWKALGIDAGDYSEWLEVIHTSGDENLKKYYDKADIALLCAPRTFYRDFAVPIKIFEYISYLKPMVVTDCTETANIVRVNNAGWVVKDNVEEIVDIIVRLCDDHSEIDRVKNNMLKAREDNLWIERAKRVVSDLEAIKGRNEG